MPTTFADISDSALKLPSVSEGTSYGTPCLRVAKSLIARLWEDGETLVLKVDPMERDILLEADLAHIETLLKRAWFAAAPKKLTKKFPDASV